jgi:uncharacterized membrane protein (DUF441 family)
MVRIPTGKIQLSPLENAQKGPAALSNSCLVGTVYINGQGVKLTTPLQVVPSLMHGTLPPLFRKPL